MIIAENEDHSTGILTRNYKSSVRSGVVRGKNFS